MLPTASLDTTQSREEPVRRPQIIERASGTLFGCLVRMPYSNIPSGAVLQRRTSGQSGRDQPGDDHTVCGVGILRHRNHLLSAHTQTGWEREQQRGARERVPSTACGYVPRSNLLVKTASKIFVEASRPRGSRSCCNCVLRTPAPFIADSWRHSKQVPSSSPASIRATT